MEGRIAGWASEQMEQSDDKEKQYNKEFQKALAYAFKLLGYRQRSQRELGQRLALKGFAQPIADKVVNKLRESNYIDDAALAENLRIQAEETKHLGLMGARQYLRKRGIGSDEANEALEGYNENEGAASLVRKKYNKTLKNCPPQIARRRLIGYLSRRGFSYDTVRKTLEAFFKEDE